MVQKNMRGNGVTVCGEVAGGCGVGGVGKVNGGGRKRGWRWGGDYVCIIDDYCTV